MTIYWPTTGLLSATGIVLGWTHGIDIVVVGICDLQISKAVNSASAGLEQRFEDYDSSNPTCDLAPIGIAGMSDSVKGGNGAQMRFVLNDELLPVSTSSKAQIILYAPPDPSRLRFFTVTPSRSIDQPEVVNQLARCTGRGSKHRNYADLQTIIELLNKVKEAQDSLLVRTAPNIPDPNAASPPRVTIARGGRDQSASSRRNTKQSASGTPVDNRPRLRNLWTASASVEQFLLRRRQLARGPSSFLSSLYNPSVDLAVRSQNYMRFWNIVWLIMNDLILGYCTRQVLLQFSETIVTGVAFGFQPYLIDAVQSALLWLNDWPVGLKLNTPLSEFFCTSLGLVIRSWSHILIPGLPAILSLSLQVVALFSLGGLTFGISLTRDLISLATVHLWLSFKITKMICDWQLGSLGGLWNLFRGKRWNVLRQRTDSYAYDVDQLFLGTLLFTVSVFLLPTVLTYSALFSLIRITLVVVDWVLRIMITALNAFPLFELMLRFKEPSRLPSGIHFETRSVKSSCSEKGPETVVYLEIHNSPRNVADILRRAGTKLS